MANEIQYAIGLQHAIEDHCHGRKIREDLGCHHHTAMLNTYSERVQLLLEDIAGSSAWEGLDESLQNRIYAFIDGEKS
jgi:hypothetical protein